MRALERYLLLQIIDQRWQEHLYDMDYLQQGIHLRGFAQIEPLVAYKNEAFELFRDLMNSVWADFARLIFHVQVTVARRERPAGRRRRRRGAAEPVVELGDGRRTCQLLRRRDGAAERGGDGRGRRRPGGGARGRLAPSRRRPGRGAASRRRHEQIGRNDPCWCGSARSTRSATAPERRPRDRPTGQALARTNRVSD